MKRFTRLEGVAAPLMMANVDTDVIIRIERLTAEDQSQLGRYAFESLRYRPDGSENPDFVLNQPNFRAATILLSGPNFGCGSSREGAVTAIEQLGFRCIIAASFGDIFFNNCIQNGLLPIRLSEAEVLALVYDTRRGARLLVDLAEKCVSANGTVYPFDIDALHRESLLEGLDDISLTLKQMDAVRAWQRQDRHARRWAWKTVARDIPVSVDVPSSIPK